MVNKTAASKTAIILGASRGLGLGLAAELAARGWQVTATQRSPSAALADAARAGGIAIDTVDIDDAAAITALTARHPGPFDVVLVNAGVSGPAHDSVSAVTGHELAALMMTNAVSPVRTARQLIDHVKPGGTVAFMSSILGSVTLHQHGMAELYSASKAALNSLTRSFGAVEGKDLAVLSLHPGWVKTDMGGAGADIDVATSVKGLADVLESQTQPGHRYLDYNGKTLPW
jgi:NAD(P)-dependent dehydrogenase (short-subunit alcohol dehydrogenase family)